MTGISCVAGAGVPIAFRARRFASTITATATMGGGSLKMIAISGSLRKGSFNSGLVRAACEIAKESFKDVELEQVDISNLPFVNTDLEKDGGFPEAVESFRSKVLEADAVLFASPEYNYSISAPLKNAVDWASRDPNAWAGKPAAIMSAGGNFGGGRAQYHLRQVGVYLDLHFINKPELFVAAFQAPPKFDSEGNLVDADVTDRIRSLLCALQEWTIKIKARKNASTITKLHIPWSIREPTNLVSSFPHLRHLSVFSHCGGNPPPALALAMSPELESLTLRCYIDCKNPSPFLRALHLRCPRIHELRLEGLPRDTTHLIEFFSPSITSLHLCCSDSSVPSCVN